MKGLNGNLSRRLSRVEVVKLSACFKCLVYLFVFQVFGLFVRVSEFS